MTEQILVDSTADYTCSEQYHYCVGYISVIDVIKVHVTTITNNNVIETNSILHYFIIKTSGV